MSGHTPGPWEVARASGLPYQIRAGQISITRWASIAAPARPEAEANARLIAAAPTMYDALLKLKNEAAGFLAMSDPCTHGTTNRAVLRERIRLAQDALSLAEGNHDEHR